MSTNQLLEQLIKQNMALAEQNAAIMSRLDELEQRVAGDKSDAVSSVEEELDTAELLGWRIDEYLQWRAEHGIPKVVPRPAVAVPRSMS
jgi:hypothetical protein